MALGELFAQEGEGGPHLLLNGQLEIIPKEKKKNSQWKNEEIRKKGIF